MPEPARTRTASRSAFLELRDEQRLVNDGYEFLDEKRILLAAELLRQRDAWREANAVFEGRWREAMKALPEAAADQGLEGLLVHPVSHASPRGRRGRCAAVRMPFVRCWKPPRRSQRSPQTLNG